MTRGQARLVVIDPIVQFLAPGVNPFLDTSIRRALAPLEALAARCACHILLVRHLNKRGAGRAVYRGLGAIGLVGVCRSAWLVAEAEEKSNRRVLAEVKNNLSAPQPALAFEVVKPADGPATLAWLGPVAATAEELLTRSRRSGPRPTARQAAAAFLVRVLADGPATVRDIWKQARAEAIPVTTLRRARKDMGVLVSPIIVDDRPVKYWRFPEQELPRDPKDDTGIGELLRALEKQYPPRTPLEDEDED